MDPFSKKDIEKKAPPTECFFFDKIIYLKKGGELIITYQLEYYEKKSYKTASISDVSLFMVI